MNSKERTRSVAKFLASGMGIAAASYAAYVGLAWFHYGKPAAANSESSDALLDMFMPNYEVVDRHHVFVDAPAEIALAAATTIHLEDSALIRGIFKARELILGSAPDTVVRPTGFLAELHALGWGILAEIPGREIVMGGVTKPWEANPVFRALPPDEFLKFDEPDYVKIIFTLRADSAAKGHSVFRTETRAVATDPAARKKFRQYWSFLSPGIIFIRRVMLPAVKAEAERRYQNVAA